MPGTLIDPAEIRGAAKPGETFTQDFFVRTVPNGTLVARLEPPVSGISLDLQALRKTIVPIPPEDLDVLPPSMRPPHGHPPGGYEEVELVGKADFGEPLAVTPDLLVHGFLKFTAPSVPKFSFASTKMVIEGFNRAKVAVVPLGFMIGELSLEFPRRSVRGIIGAQTTFPIRVSLPEGVPPTTLTFSARGIATIGGASVTVEGGKSVDVTLSLSVSISAQPGRIDTEIWVDGVTRIPIVFPFSFDAVRAAPSQPTQAEIQAKFLQIDRFYRSNGSFRGQLGFPLAPPKFQNGIASRLFAGGTVKLLNQTITIEDRYYVRVRYVGCKCTQESSELSASDEPYFLIGVAASNGGNTVRFGPYEDVDAGDTRFEATDIVAHDHRLVPPIFIGIAGMEHDEGTPEEAERKVREVVQSIVEKFEQAVGSFTGADTGSFVIPGWARDILIGWVPEGIAALFGMGDDLIGKNTVLLFDDKPMLEARTQFPIKGTFGQNEYTHMIPLGEDDGEGMYELYFKVDLFYDVQPIMPPRP